MKNALWTVYGRIWTKTRRQIVLIILRFNVPTFQWHHYCTAPSYLLWVATGRPDNSPPPPPALLLGTKSFNQQNFLHNFGLFAEVYSESS